MFGDRHYVPALRWRQGEFGALQELSNTQKNGITPLIDVPPIPWDFAEEKPAKTIDAHLARMPEQMVKSWGHDHPIFISSSSRRIAAALSSTEMTCGLSFGVVSLTQRAKLPASMFSRLRSGRVRGGGGRSPAPRESRDVMTRMTSCRALSVSPVGCIRVGLQHVARRQAFGFAGRQVRRFASRGDPSELHPAAAF
jgi:hypothetical protein